MLSPADKRTLSLFIAAFFCMGIGLGWSVRGLREYYKGPYECSVRKRALQGCEEVATDMLHEAEQAEWKFEGCSNRLKNCLEFHIIPQPGELE